MVMEKQLADPRGPCPFGLTELHLDIAGYLLGRCGWCEAQSFGSSMAFNSLMAEKWIWEDERRPTTSHFSCCDCLIASGTSNSAIHRKGVCQKPLVRFLTCHSH